MARNTTNEPRPKAIGGEGTPSTPLKANPREWDKKLKSPAIKEKKGALAGTGSIGSSKGKMKGIKK